MAVNVREQLLSHYLQVIHGACVELHVIPATRCMTSSAMKKFVHVERVVRCRHACVHVCECYNAFQNVPGPQAAVLEIELAQQSALPLVHGPAPAP